MHTFGNIIKQARLSKGLGLRQAAKLLGVDPTYLSKLEHDVSPPPSGTVLLKISAVYETPRDDLLRAASHRAPEVIAALVGKDRNLEALFRVAQGLPPGVVLDLVKEALQRAGRSQTDIEMELKRLEQEFLRLPRKSAGLFAPRVKPRFHSKRVIEQWAEQFLGRRGLDERRYVPPTPVEPLVSDCKGIEVIWHEEIDADQASPPRVLGLTRWGANGSTRMIYINPKLADDSSDLATYRINFTLAHELFHAIEHLVLIDQPDRARGACMRGPCSIPQVRPTLADGGLPQPARVGAMGGRRKLVTPEDWCEWQSNAFAAALLMPSFAVKREFATRFDTDCVLVPKTDDPRLVAHQHAVATVGRIGQFLPLFDAFQVSRHAMAIRLRELGVVAPG